MADQLERQLKELERQKERGVLTDEEYAARRQALVTAAPVVAEKKRGGFMKWGLIGCVGIFAAVGIFFVAVIALLAAAFSSSDSAEDSGGDVRSTLTAGASGVISAEGNGAKKSKVTVLQIADSASSANMFLQPDAGKKFWAIEVEIENVGTQEVTSLDWKLRDSKDLEHDRQFMNDVGPNIEVFYNLTPGGKTRGWVVFEIDADATPKWLRADPNPFLANDLYFDAQ